MNTVIVLLSTFNGEKFIREQLDSIFEQKDVIVKLIVRDDGSEDNTLSILNDYKCRFPNQINIIEGNNIGWKKSFFELIKYAYLNYSDNNYLYAFSDQDDIWLPEKLSVAAQILKKMTSGANLYCCNQFYYKNGINYGKIHQTTIVPTYKNCLVRNYATGCTIVFNHRLLSLLNKDMPSIDTAHDYWVYQAAVLCGNVYVDDNAYILYRQHENNQIGSKSGKIEVWKRRLKNFSDTFSGHKREERANALIKSFSTDMYPDALNATRKMALYRKKWRNQIALLIDSGYSLNSPSNDFWLKLRILFKHL